MVELGFAICLYLFLFTDHLEIKWDKFAQFFAFMCFIIMVKTAVAGNQVGLADVETWQYTIVFWEDAVFMTPIYYCFEKWGRNKWTIAVAVICSLAFGMGHIYHGLVGALVTCFYPYFISYRYAKKTSIGTVMACHVLYDLMLLYSVLIFS
jgi:membrane protease YdiL (CAAX protease family)